MPIDATIHQVSSGLTIWQRYDPAVKADLFSTLITTPSGFVLVDPSHLPPAALSALLGGHGVAGIVITNANHARATGDFAEQFGSQIYAHREAKADLAGRKTRDVTDGVSIVPGLEAITIDGAAPGEIALHCQAEGGTLILGDALINMDSLGFSYLPTKYCTNSKMMRKSLHKLLRYRCERILFAHGMPIVAQASRRLAELLEGGQPA